MHKEPEYTLEYFRSLEFDQENLRLWIEALKSGNYPQTTQSLKSKAGYCCLGVLCEVSKLVRFDEANNNSGYVPVMLEDEERELSNADPPNEVVTWVIPGYVNSPPSCKVNAVLELIEMNDALQLTFAEIAEFLEQFLTAEESQSMSVKTLNSKQLELILKVLDLARKTVEVLAIFDTISLAQINQVYSLFLQLQIELEGQDWVQGNSKVVKCTVVQLANNNLEVEEDF